MKYEQVLSFRADEDIIRGLNELKVIHSYWNRTFIIVALLRAFLRFADRGTQFQILKSALDNKGRYRLTFEKID